MIKQERVKLGYTQRQVAKYLNVTAEAICQYETGKRKIGIDKLQKLAILYNCTIDDLVNETNNKEEVTQ